ncbi:pyridoxine 5'-phosphate oxidase C-terminal domain-containing protein [Streptomyces sp. NPDC055189]
MAGSRAPGAAAGAGGHGARRARRGGLPRTLGPGTRRGGDPGLVADAWTLYTVAPVTVEFWQADTSRVHTRLRYERAASGAPRQKHLLWP